MGRVNTNDIDNYAANQGGFFGLKDHGDTAQIRFMYEGYDDMAAYAVHEIDVDGKKRYVSCLRAYNEPVHNCPLCEAGYKVAIKFFVPVLEIDPQTGNGEVKIWDRGRTFKQKLDSLLARYQPLCATIFEVERRGKKGDTNTTYETFPVSTDENLTLADLPEVPEVLGGLVLDKTFDDLLTYVETGAFPATQAEAPVDRRQATAPRQAETPARRPASPAPAAPAQARPAQRPAPAAPAARRPGSGGTNRF